MHAPTDETTHPARALRRRAALAALATGIVVGTLSLIGARATSRCTVDVIYAGDPATWRSDPVSFDDPRLHFRVRPPMDGGPIWLPSSPFDVPGSCIDEQTRSSIRGMFNPMSVHSVSIHVHDAPGDLRFTVGATSAPGGIEDPLGTVRLTTHPTELSFRNDLAKLLFELLSVASVTCFVALGVEWFLHQRRRALADARRYLEGRIEADGAISLDGQPNALPVVDRALPPGPVLIVLGETKSADYRTAPTPPILELIARSRSAETARLASFSRRVLSVPIALAAITLAGSLYFALRALDGYPLLGSS